MGASIELADILRVAGPAFRASGARRLSLAELKVMSAIETCRTAALGGHVEGCDDCDHLSVAYNSCRNLHCPRCQGAAARNWLAEREADLLPVGYFHVVFTLPTEIGAVAFQNKAAVYDLLFRASTQTMTTIAADPKHFGARIGLTAVLHTWGAAMTHHPHIHMIVPGGGLSPDRTRWIASRSAFLLPVRVLGALFRRLFLEGSPPCTPPAGSPSTARSPISPIREPSPFISPRCAANAGSSTPSRPSPGHRPFWPTCRATPTASPSRRGASSPSTAAPSPSASKTIARTAPPVIAP